MPRSQEKHWKSRNARNVAVVVVVEVKINRTGECPKKKET